MPKAVAAHLSDVAARLRPLGIEGGRRGNERIEQLALTLLLAGLGIGLPHRKALADRAAAPGGDDPQAGEHRALHDG